MVTKHIFFVNLKIMFETLSKIEKEYILDYQQGKLVGYIDCLLDSRIITFNTWHSLTRMIDTKCFSKFMEIRTHERKNN